MRYLSVKSKYGFRYILSEIEYDKAKIIDILLVPYNRDTFKEDVHPLFDETELEKAKNFIVNKVVNTHYSEFLGLIDLNTFQICDY